ncbi:Putative beta-lactamase-inhibitor-like, PepSY-like [Nitrosomonas marina]|uniref:Putative beta-lactamase-inhibitor-like, PepSY-like n=1 Tax=Nitrosomonas marina TaxID=917 RepID=A0A1I0BF51_9PROT|nr:PepSY domain-containing protein [Nitrosomonas marina]SET05590.1 Putative beta-lactamase-inhibitor-like, PepSY-like [Nitrosomonas marina]
MNTQFWVTVALVVLFTTSGQLVAGEKEEKELQVPKAVLDAFEKAYPNAQEVEFEEETIDGKIFYEIEYKENGKEFEILYDVNGVIVQKEETIDVKNLPDQIVQAINTAYPKATIEEAEKLMKADGTVIGYEVEIKAEGKEYELELDASGKILKTEED